MHQELQKLFQQDQADRTGRHPDTGTRDGARRQQIEALIAAGALQAPEDYYHAAMIYQHAFHPVVTIGPNKEVVAVSADEESVRCVWRAHELALRAADQGYTPARWLAAAAYDRWLEGQGKPQKYGTQSLGDKLWQIDPATSDAERAAWDVKPLAELRPGESSMACRL